MTKYWKTAAGTHRHSSVYCANERRAFQSGYPTEIPAGQIKNFAPCAHCCTVDEIRETVTTSKTDDEMCSNSGVINGRKVYSNCKDCGKEGKVLGNGSIKGHKPIKK